MSAAPARLACALLLSVLPALSQEPDSNDFSAAALTASKQDPAAVARGGKAYVTYCAGCHGASAKGGPGAPDLVRSLVVLDDDNGNQIGPVIREGRPDKGMPKLGLTDAQITDVVAWLHVKTYAAGHRNTYAYQNIVTGDPKKGEAYFNSQGKCSGCHSPTGDLAGVGRKYEALALQGRWLQPRIENRGGGGARRRGPSEPSGKSAVTVSVTPTNGQTVSGILLHIDDFEVSLRDAKGLYRSFSREGPQPPKVEVHDPLKAHDELLTAYSDADIHNVTAFLVTLK